MQRPPDCLMDAANFCVPTKGVWDVPVGCPIAKSPDACAHHVPTEALIAAYVHTCNALPLFAVLAPDLDTIDWRAGGIDFDGIAGPHGQETLAGLLAGLGVTRPGSRALMEAMRAAAPGEAGGPVEFQAAGGRSFALLYRRRPCPPYEIQITLTEVTNFARAARRAQAMARQIVNGLERQPLPDVGDGVTAAAVLRALPAALADLERRHDEAALRADAAALAARVDAVAGLAVHLLRSFEEDDDDDFDRHRRTWHGHARATGEWGWQDVLEAARTGRLRLPELLQAWSFARQAQPTLLVSPDGRRVIVVNGALAGTWFEDVPALLGGLDVESNSRRTAGDFFAAIAAAPKDAAFVVGDRTVEARGHPIKGGWQAALTTATQHVVDVRGLFHGLKNLLLNLQVLHVVGTKADLEATASGLRSAADGLLRRLGTLEAVARGGRIDAPVARETVEDWLAAARLVADRGKRVLRDDVPAPVRALAYKVMPDDVGDALAELVRNAYDNGAASVTLAAAAEDGRLTICVRDDGPGMSAAKLAQVRRVLARGRYDPSLSSRPGGTGNGLLAVSKAAQRLLGGGFDIDSGPNGTVCRLHLDLPPGSVLPAVAA